MVKKAVSVLLLLVLGFFGVRVLGEAQQWTQHGCSFGHGVVLAVVDGAPTWYEYCQTP